MLSLENLFLNTNFINLLEEKGVSQDLINLMENRGTHTAEVDAVLNAYLSDFIQTGKLHMERMPTPGSPLRGLSDAAAAEYMEKQAQIESLMSQHGFLNKDSGPVSAFRKFLVNRIRRSAAVTPVTNVSDITRVSEDFFGFLRETEIGKQKVSVIVDQDFASSIPGLSEALSTTDAEGRIFYDKQAGRYRLAKFNTGKIVDLDQDVARSAIDATLDLARLGKEGAENVNGIKINRGTERLLPISVTQLEQTEFNQMLNARRAAKTTTSAISTNPEQLSEALGTTRQFYGVEGGFRPAVTGLMTAEGVPLDEAYRQAVTSRGLPYSTLDIRSRIMATAEAEATAGIGRRIFSRISTAQAAGMDPKTLSALATEGVLEKLSDVGIQFAIGQGKEQVFGIERAVDQGGRQVSQQIAMNSYIRTPIPGVPKNSRIIMTADDLANLQVRFFDPDNKAIGAVQFGSDDFIKNTSLNRFVDSVVQGEQAENIINRAWAPKLSTMQAEDLADQVISLNLGRYATLSNQRAYIYPKITEEVQALSRNIFGQELGQSMTQELLELAKMATLEERETYLRTLAKNKGVADNFFENYMSQVRSVAESINETFITGMKIQGAAETEAIIASRVTQGISTAGETDEALKRRVHRLIKVFRTDEGVVGAAYSPSVTESMDEAVRVVNKEALDTIGATRAMEDQHALNILESTAQMASKKDVVRKTVGSPAEQFTDNAVNAGRKFYQANRNKFLIGALATAAAVVGYKTAKRREENELYESTMAIAPYEEGRRPYGIQEALMNGTSRRKDPLFTAGVVGNLDRQKIGHTSMGSTKYNHLFGE